MMTILGLPRSSNLVVSVTLLVVGTSTWFELDQVRRLEQSAEFVFNRARAYRAAHEDGKARIAFEKYLAIVRTRGDNRLVANALASEGRFASMCNSPDAIQYFDRALALRPDYAHGYEDRAFCFYRQGQYKRALADFSSAIKLDPQIAEPYQYRSAVYLRMGDFDAALADANSAIQIDPQNYWSVAARARVYAKMQKNDLARTDWNNVIALNLDHVPCFYEYRAEFFDSINESALARQDRATAAALQSK